MDEIALKFTNQEVGMLLAALGEMPFRIASPIIGKIQTQAQAAMAAKTEDETNG